MNNIKQLNSFFSLHVMRMAKIYDFPLRDTISFRLRSHLNSADYIRIELMQELREGI